MALKKNGPVVSDEMSLLNEVPAFIKREASPSTPTGGKDWIMFPDGMPPVSKIIGNEPIMVQSEEAEEPLTITPDDIKRWLTGDIESGSTGFITGDILYNKLLEYVPKTTTINGHALTGNITLTKGDIGLGNVDNTSDLDKPISNAVNNRFQELEDTWGVDISQLKVDVSNIDTLLDSTVIEVNRLSGIIDDLDTDFTDHMTDINAHSNIRVDRIQDAVDPSKIPNISAVISYVREYLPGLPNYTVPAPQASFKDSYLYLQNWNTQYKIKVSNFMGNSGMINLYPTVVSLASDFPDTGSITPGTLVRVGNITGSIIDQYTGYEARKYELLHFNGTTYEHIGYTNREVSLSATQSDNTVKVGYVDNDNDTGVLLPLASLNSAGVLSMADYNTFYQQRGLTKYGTPNDSWSIGYSSDDEIVLQKGESGNLDLLWNNVNNPTEGPDDPTTGKPTLLPDYYAGLTVGNLTIKGDVIQEGNSYISQAETVKVSDNIFTLNNGELGAGVTKGTAGVEIDRGTLPKYLFIFDEVDDRFKVGTEGNLWPVMLRDNEADLVNGNLLIWDSTTKRAKTGKNLDTELAKYLPLAGNTIQTPITGIIYGSEGNYLNFNVVDSTAVWGSVNVLSLSKDDVIIPNTPLKVFKDIYSAGSDSNANTIFKVWNAGNDGHGSGLDADTLDGIHASELAIASNFIPLAGNDSSKPITGPLIWNATLGGGGEIVTPYVNMGFNQDRRAFIRALNANIGLSTPIYSSYMEMGMETLAGDAPYNKSYIRVGFDQGVPVLKYHMSGDVNVTVGEFDIYHTGNLNVGSLATNSALSGYLPLAGGTMTGNIVMGYHQDLAFNDYNGDVKSFIRFNEEEGYLEIYADIPSGVPGASISLWSNGDVIHNAIKNGVINRAIMWDSLNDGTGSGLDADLLDGRHATDFALATDYLPLTAGTSKPLTGQLVLHGYDNGGWASFRRYLIVGDGGDHSGMEFISNDTILGMGSDSTGSTPGAYFWVGNSDNATKSRFMTVGKGDKVVMFSERPKFGSTDLALVSEIPTTLPANGGTSAFSNMLNVYDTRNAPITPNFEGHHFFTWFSNNGTPDSNWWSGIHINGWDTDYAGWELASESHNTMPGPKTLYFRTGLGGSWNGWKKIAFTEDIPQTLPASDVYPWAKASIKPQYYLDEVLARMINVQNGGYKERKHILHLSKPDGYISRIGIGSYNSSSSFSYPMIYGGKDDNGTLFTDWIFNVGTGRITDSLGHTVAWTSEIPSLSGYLYASKLDFSTVGPVSTYNGNSVPTTNVLAYWNGAYSVGGGSNLQYCDRGRFGTMVTQNATDYVNVGATQTITGAKTFTSYVIMSAGAGTAAASDMRFKNVKAMLPDNILDIVINAPAFSYTWKDEDIRAIGTSAQYWQSFIPELVIEMDDEYKTRALCYDRLPVILIDALKAEHKKREEEKKVYEDKINMLISRIEALEARLPWN